jgi:hypothetical protein
MVNGELIFRPDYRGVLRRHHRGVANSAQVVRRRSRSVEATAKELLLPGAMVLLRTPPAAVLHDWRAIPLSASSLMKSVSRATKASSIFRLNGGCVNCSRLRTNTLH